MGLEVILRELGADTPFGDDGNYTSEGLIALEKLLKIADELEYIGVLGKNRTQLEEYLDEVVRLGF